MRAGNLGKEVRLAGQVRFVHRAVTFDDRGIDGTRLVRKDDQPIANHDVGERNILNRALGLAMSRRGHALGQRFKRRRRAPHRVRFERLSAREHQHDDRPGQVFAEQHRRDDGDAGENVGTKVELHDLVNKTRDQRHAADEQRGKQWQVDVGDRVKFAREMQPVAQDQMHRNRRDRKRGDEDVA